MLSERLVERRGQDHRVVAINLFSHLSCQTTVITHGTVEYICLKFNFVTACYIVNEERGGGGFWTRTMHPCVPGITS